jgi:hypothetical protein
MNDDLLTDAPGHLGGVALDDEVEVRRRPAEQQVANGAADQIDPRQAMQPLEQWRPGRKLGDAPHQLSS